MATHSLPGTAECVIIGGGVVGCSLAYHLARDGVRPLLLERGSLGEGSTARCAGGVRQQFATEVNVRVGMMSMRMLERFPEELGATADLRQVGYLFVASSAEEQEQFARNVEMQRAVGLRDVQLLDVEGVRALVPELRTDDLYGGSFCPSDGLAGPNEVTAGYAGAARRAGALIVEGCEVSEVLRSGGRVTGVRTADGATVSAPLVVNCAGPYAALVGRMAGVELPAQVQGRSVREVLTGRAAEHRPFVISSWPLYFAKGELTSAVDSRRRRIASYMPVTVSTRRWSLIMGGPSEAPELYDLERDPQEASNVWAEHVDEGSYLFKNAIEFLRSVGTAEKFVKPREESLAAFAAAG